MPNAENKIIDGVSFITNSGTRIVSMTNQEISNTIALSATDKTINFLSILSFEDAKKVTDKNVFLYNDIFYTVDVPKYEAYLAAKGNTAPFDYSAQGTAVVSLSDAAKAAIFKGKDTFKKPQTVVVSRSSGLAKPWWPSMTTEGPDGTKQVFFFDPE